MRGTESAPAVNLCHEVNAVSKFVAFQVSVSGKTVFINPDQVTHLTDHENGKTGVVLSTGTVVEIDGQPGEVANKLSPS